MELYVGDTWYPNDILTELVTTETANKAGSLNFSCIRGFDAVTAEKQIVRMIDGSDTVFRGRVLTASRKTVGVMTVVCEGELAFFNDSMTKGTTRTGYSGNLLRYLLNEHNGNVSDYQQLTAGIIYNGNSITVKGSDTDEVPTMELIAKIAEASGLIISTENGSLNLRGATLNRQKIQFGENLISFKQEQRKDDIFTRIYAYGEDSEGNRITLYHLLGVPYVEDAEAIAQYGVIAKRVNFPAESEQELERKARAELRRSHSVNITIEALDLHWKDSTVPRFRVGNVQIISPPDDYNGVLMLHEVRQDWLNPGKNTIKIGTTRKIV